MSRKIEFKVWDNEQKMFLEDVPVIESWIDSDSWDDPEQLLDDPYHWQSAPTYNNRLVWLQYIGVNDIYGNEIYEGDIIKLADGNSGYVYFEDGRFMHNAIPIVDGISCWNEVEIISNIFENNDFVK